MLVRQVWVGGGGVPSRPSKCAGRYFRVYALVLGFWGRNGLHRLPQATGERHFQKVRVGRGSLCSQAPLLPLGIPPKPAPAMLPTKNFPKAVNFGECSPPPMRATRRVPDTQPSSAKAPSDPCPRCVHLLPSTPASSKRPSACPCSPPPSPRAQRVSLVGSAGTGAHGVRHVIGPPPYGPCTRCCSILLCKTAQVGTDGCRAAVPEAGVAPCSCKWADCSHRSILHPNSGRGFPCCLNLRPSPPPPPPPSGKRAPCPPFWSNEHQENLDRPEVNTPT